ncbi:MAG TPA: rhodanese-like domain-containing protein [Dyadobacter sp.]|nr:rhodanese-like domain-containing protein [Dyadobacter sp.]
MGILSLFFGNNKADLKELARKGALIVDVRSAEEFASGHIDGSINIPLDQINTKTTFLKTFDKAVITCCRSGVRSGMAEGLLKAAGVQVYNGGAWDKLRKKIQ